MTSTEDGNGSEPKSAPADGATAVLSPGRRKAAMSSIDAMEIKWSKAGLIISAGFAIFLPLYATSLHTAKDKTTNVKDEAVVIGAVVLLLTVMGFIGLIRRKRSFLAFSFFIIGLAFTLTFAPLGLAMIILGGWLMLRAFRIQKYGTANAKLAAREAATRPPRRERKAAAIAASKPVAHKAPSANKRYTPKAPARKKVPKPTE